MYTFDWLAKQADMRPDKCALIDAATDRSFTYAEFHLRASRFAEFLRDEWQVRPGERVALLANNSSDYFEILWGCAKVGADPGLPQLAARRARARVDDARLVAGRPDLRPALRGVRRRAQGAARARPHDDAGDRQAPAGEWAYEGALAHASGKPSSCPRAASTTSGTSSTPGGTTGRSKGVLQTFGMVFYNALNIGLKIDLTSRGRDAEPAAVLPHRRPQHVTNPPSTSAARPSSSAPSSRPRRCGCSRPRPPSSSASRPSICSSASTRTSSSTDLSQRAVVGSRRRADPNQPAAALPADGASTSALALA